MKDQETSDTPTADAAEAFLREKREDMSIENNIKEDSFEVFQSNISKDPLRNDNINYNVLKALGYPIKFQEGAVDIQGKPRENDLRVMVDSEKTKQKIHQIRQKLTRYDIDMILLGDVGVGIDTGLECLLTNQIDTVYKQHPTVMIKRLLSPEMRPVLEQAFMAAYERSRQRHENLDLHKKTNALYDQLKSKGVRPIDAELLGLLEMSAIQDILRRFPELRPDNYQEPLTLPEDQPEDLS